MLFFHAKAGQGQYYKEGPAKTRKERPRRCCSLRPKSDQQHLANTDAQQQADPSAEGQAQPQLLPQPPITAPVLPQQMGKARSMPEATSRLGPVLQTEQKGEKGCMVFTSRQRKPGKVSLETSTAVMASLI